MDDQFYTGTSNEQSFFKKNMWLIIGGIGFVVLLLVIMIIIYVYFFSDNEYAANAEIEANNAAEALEAAETAVIANDMIALIAAVDAAKEYAANAKNFAHKAQTAADEEDASEEITDDLSLSFRVR